MTPIVLPTAPRYGTASLAEVLPDATAALNGHGSRLLGLPEGLDGVVVLVLDGLGRALLDAHAEIAPRLASGPGPMLDAPFPTTTATSLTTLGTGLAPGEHGVVGYSFAVPGTDRPLVVVTWSWDRHDLALDARDEVAPEDLQPRSTAFAVARDAGVRPVTVLPAEFADSGLTRAGLRGGEVVHAKGLASTLAAAVEAADATPGPTLVYAHHPEPDATGHLTGPGSEQWMTKLAAIDAEVDRAVASLPHGVALVVTADHGMLRVPDEGLVELADRPDLLAGVRVLTGDARARQLHTRPGAHDDVLSTWREHAGGSAHVLTRDEAIAAGWFGPLVTEAARSRIGDVVVCARDPGVGWVHRDVDLFGGRLPGMHGALTRDEVEVPALVFTTDEPDHLRGR